MIDSLLQKIDAMKNPTVVGLDPTLEMMPPALKAQMLEIFGKTPQAVGKMFVEFNKEIIDCIADIKRGDISSTAAAYASHIQGTEIEGEEFDLWKEDWITINPYLGIDGIQPFIDACNNKDRGIFILVKTSNPSSRQLQDIVIDNKTIYETVAELVEEWGMQSMGHMGYSRIGAVVGATHKEQGVRLRSIMPHTFFLVPGYGAQGGTGADLKGFFDKEGRGCIVNSSRGIIAAYKKSDKYGENVGEAARDAALAMKADLQY